MRPAIVTTTIHVPTLLGAYVDDALTHGHDVRYVVIGDRKTPPEAKTWCQRLASEKGVDLEFQDVEDQAGYLRAHPELDAHLPYDSIQRRNIGILLAYERGCDPIITIDDDNFLLDDDFVGRHGLAGRAATLPALTSDTGWVNVCRDLEDVNGVPFYHRGFPPGQRWRDEQTVESERTGRVVVNAGLWLGDPDVDALQRLVYPVEAVRHRRDGNVALGPGTWSPFNSQNTALAREVVPAYFLSPRIGRYDDIWASYVVVRIADHLGHLVAYGKPVVRQERNPHDYWKDLAVERDPMRVTDAFCAALRDVPLSAGDYAGCLREVVAGLGDWVGDGAGGLSSEQRAPVRHLLEGLEIWDSTLRELATDPV